MTTNPVNKHLGDAALPQTRIVRDADSSSLPTAWLVSCSTSSQFLACSTSSQFDHERLTSAHTFGDLDLQLLAVRLVDHDEVARGAPRWAHYLHFLHHQLPRADTDIDLRSHPRRCELVLRDGNHVVAFFEHLVTLS